MSSKLINKLKYVSKVPSIIVNQRINKNSLILNTMRKSGSHYLMAILSNYFMFKIIGEDKRLDFVEMKELFWNAKSDSPQMKKFKQLTGYSKLIWEHENRFILLNNAKSIIHTYRNPLDNIVSRYFYIYKNRSSSVSISDIIDVQLLRFIKHYLIIASNAERENVIKVAYEDLIRNTHPTVASILSFCGLPINEEYINLAITSSSKKKVKFDESKYGLENKNLVAEGVNESFVRSGKIGEWKDFLSEADVLYIDQFLAKNNINLSDFIIE